MTEVVVSVIVDVSPLASHRISSRSWKAPWRFQSSSSSLSVDELGSSGQGAMTAGGLIGLEVLKYIRSFRSGGDFGVSMIRMDGFLSLSSVHLVILRDDLLRDRLVFRRLFDRCLDRPRRSVRVRRSVWSRLTELCSLCLSEHFGVVDRLCCLIIARFSPFIRFNWCWASLTDFFASYNLSLVLAIKSLSWSSWLAIDVELLECFIVGLV